MMVMMMVMMMMMMVMMMMMMKMWWWCDDDDGDDDDDVMMMMMMLMMMILFNSATKFRHGMDKFYQPNSGLRGSRSRDEAIYTVYWLYFFKGKSQTTTRVTRKEGTIIVNLHSCCWWSLMNAIELLVFCKKMIGGEIRWLNKKVMYLVIVLDAHLRPSTFIFKTTWRLVVFFGPNQTSPDINQFSWSMMGPQRL